MDELSTTSKTSSSATLLHRKYQIFNRLWSRDWRQHKDKLLHQRSIAIAVVGVVFDSLLYNLYEPDKEPQTKSIGIDMNWTECCKNQDKVFYVQNEEQTVRFKITNKSRRISEEKGGTTYSFDFEKFNLVNSNFLPDDNAKRTIEVTKLTLTEAKDPSRYDEFVKKVAIRTLKIIPEDEADTDEEADAADVFDDSTSERIEQQLQLINIEDDAEEYRLMYVYATNLNDDFSSKVIELANNHMVPMQLKDFEKIPSRNRSEYEQPILNVIVICDSSDAKSVLQVNKYLRPEDLTVILFTSTYEIGVLDDIWTKLSTKVLILSKTFLASVNQFRVDRINKIAIQPLDEIAIQRFINQYLYDKVNASGAKMTVFMRNFNPKSVLSPVAKSNNYTFDGPDGIVSDLLFKSLNITATYVTDILIISPSFYSWKRLPYVQLGILYYKYHKEMTTSNQISSFNTTDDSSLDFHMTSYMVEPDWIDDVLNLSTDRLYPHDTDCFVIVVPEQTKISNFLGNFFKNGNIQSICCVLLLFVAVRIIIQRAFFDQWLSITFKTLQLFLVQGGIKNRNAVETSWAIILRGFSLLAITTISAIMYKSLMNIQHKEIDTISELIASNLTVVVPISQKPQFKSFWKNIDPDLRKNIKFKDDDQSGANFLTGKMYGGYVLHEEQASLQIRMSGSIREDGVRSHIMKEKLHCRLTSYRIAKTSPFKRATNEFVRKCFENGLYNKILKWSMHYNNARFKANRIPKNRGEIVLEIEIVYSVFVWYLAAMLLSFSVFVTEILINFSKRQNK